MSKSQNNQKPPRLDFLEFMKKSTYHTVKVKRLDGSEYALTKSNFSHGEFNFEITFPQELQERYIMLERIQKWQTNLSSEINGINILCRCVMITDQANLMVMGINDDGRFIYDKKRISHTLITQIKAMVIANLAK